MCGGKRIRVTGFEEFCEYLAHCEERYVKTMDGTYTMNRVYQYLNILFRHRNGTMEVTIYDIEEKTIIYHKRRFIR